MTTQAVCFCHFVSRVFHPVHAVERPRRLYLLSMIYAPRTSTQRSHAGRLLLELNSTIACMYLASRLLRFRHSMSLLTRVVLQKPWNSASPSPQTLGIPRRKHTLSSLARMSITNQELCLRSSESYLLLITGGRLPSSTCLTTSEGE